MSLFQFGITLFVLMHIGIIRGRKQVMQYIKHLAAPGCAEHSDELDVGLASRVTGEGLRPGVVGGLS